MSFLDRVVDYVVPTFLGGLVLAFLCLVGFVIWDSVHAEKFSLRKDSWQCTKSHKETSYNLVGKVLVPITRNVCDNYERNK